MLSVTLQNIVTTNNICVTGKITVNWVGEQLESAGPIDMAAEVWWQGFKYVVATQEDDMGRFEDVTEHDRAQYHKEVTRTNH